MKISKTFLQVMVGFLLPVVTSCHHNTLEDKAEKECRDFTMKNCPTPYINSQRTDSITFTRADKTIHYYYRLNGNIDNPEIIEKMRLKLINIIKKSWTYDTHNITYLKAGFRFHVVFRSASTGKVLLETTLPHP